MAGIFKKAMGLFVEFEEDPTNTTTSPSSKNPAPPSARPAMATQTMNAEDADKFEKHFEKMFEQANFPGPDYYEFWKMMETLEAHIKDEKALISATFASLSIQGLTKEKLIETANKYKQIIDQDKENFEKVASDKSQKDIGNKKNELKQHEETIAKHSEMIQRLTKEITDSQQALGKLKSVIADEENRLAKNRQGYHIACEAMKQKITEDINKIQSTL